MAGLLRKAARASDEFYGLMAQRLLDERIRFDWRREELRQEMVQLLVRYPAGIEQMPEQKRMLTQ